MHLGLLAIALLLLFLNVASNYILYQARTSQQQEALADLKQAAVMVSRQVQQAFPAELSEADLEKARNEFRLSGLVIVPSRPIDDTEDARREWLRDVISRLPKNHLPMVAEALFTAEFHQLARGEGTQYYFLYPIPSGAGHNLLLLTVERPVLAYIDDSRSTLFVIQIASLGFLAMVYVLLSRFIFAPFRRIRKTAKAAGRPVGDEEDETEAIVRDYEDIIEQLRENEAELLRLNAAIQHRADTLEEFNQLLLESGQAGILTINTDGQLIGANERAMELLRLNGAEIIGQPVETVLSHVPGMVESITEAVQSGRVAAYREYGELFGEDSDAVLGVSLTSITSPDHEHSGLLVFVNDVTETARLRHEVESKKRLVALGEMAGGLAHQIRNSLGAISGYANLCKKQLRKAGEAEDRADTLLDETREAESLIGRFLTFARPFDFTPAPMRLDILIRETVEQFEVQENCGNITFDIDAPKAVTIEADQVLLKQVLGNLISNAVQAYECRPGTIRLELEAGRDLAQINVRDQAGGIPADEQESIFTPFYSSRPSGTGLGLPLAERIVDLHGGRLSVESEVGKGSCFKIVLPVQVPAGQPSERTKTPHLA